jgi:hypothetical protein
MNKRNLLLAYQLLTGASDTATGTLLLLAPVLTLHLMKLQAPTDALVFLSYMGAFVLSVGIACLYGALLATQRSTAEKIEVVWLLTAITRGIVAVFVAVKIASGQLEMGWIAVALSDGALAAVQLIGLRKGWLRDAAR